MDLTTGEPSKVLRKYSVPLMGSIIFQQLYSIADTFTAGQFIGEKALAAVGNSYEITLIYLAFAVGCNMGASVLTALAFGAKDFRQMKSSISTAYIVSGAIMLLLTVFGLIFTPALLKAINTGADFYDDCLSYLNIYTYGLVFLFFYNISTAVFSAFGDSRTPFIFLAITSVTNIALDIVFVAVLHMGVAGTGWATFICQGVSCIVSNIVLFFKLRKICGKCKFEIFSSVLFRKMMRVAIPSTCQQGFVSIGNLMIQRVINGFGTEVTGGYAAAVKYNTFIVTTITTVGNGISNYTAQNIGARHNDRIKPGYAAAIRMAVIVALGFTLVCWPLAPRLISLFAKDSVGTAEGANYYGTLFLRIISPAYAVVAVKIISDGVLRGALQMKQFMATTFTDMALRVIGVYLLSALFGKTGIWVAWPVCWVFGTLLSVFFLHRYFKKHINPELLLNN